MDLDNDDQVRFSFACQVLEYHPQPWNRWIKVGDLQRARSVHATLSIGPEQLACLSGESFNMGMIIKVIERKRMIGKGMSSKDFTELFGNFYQMTL